jgi:hypothetical protein
MSSANAISTQPSWLMSLDHAVQRAGDWLNPILVKEARQALKSRQFVITFTLLLLAAWGWTAGAILMLMPRIYYVPSGQFLLVGYYFVLAVPMLLVVPLAAHRSLASEIDDGTLDLLSVTTLSSMQIVTGKLASAALQLMLYLVALFPCVAFSYALRGVDILSISILILLTVTVALLLTVIGLFLASLPGGRSGQLGMLVFMLLIVVGAQFVFGPIAVAIIQEGIVGNISGLSGFAFVVISTLLYASTFAVILLRAAVAQLSPPSENRSTPVRRAIFWHQAIMTGCIAYSAWSEEIQNTDLYAWAYFAAAFWMIMGTLLVGESPILSPRVRRNLPSSFFTRSLWIWFTPGPGTGLVFAIAGFVTFVISLYWIYEWAVIAQLTIAQPRYEVLPHAMLLTGYVMFFLSLGRWAMLTMRLRGNVHPAVSLAVMVIVVGVFALAPYSIELFLNDYRAINWSRWQMTNWIWTMEMMMSNRLSDDVPYLVLTMGSVTFMIALLTLGRVVMPLRMATPQRVLEEQEAERSEEFSLNDSDLDPLAS